MLFRSRYDNAKVDKAVIGHFYDLEEAMGQEDIKETLFSDAGYLADFSGEGVDITVFAKDDVWRYTFIMRDAVEVEKALFDEAPLIGSEDTNIHVEGAVELDTYAVPYYTDTYYGYGYQTILVNDLEVDLSSVVPVFVEGNCVVVQIGSEKQISGETVKDFSNGNVQYKIGRAHV